MKLRIFMGMEDSVYRIVIDAEDWSQGDIELMERFGEPDVDVGGTITYSDVSSSGSESSEDVKTKDFGNEYVRVLHGFPYARGFDSRDYGSVDSAVSAGTAWKDLVVSRFRNVIAALRANVDPISTEEVVNL